MADEHFRSVGSVTIAIAATSCNASTAIVGNNWVRGERGDRCRDQPSSSPHWRASKRFVPKACRTLRENLSKTKSWCHHLVAQRPCSVCWSEQSKLASWHVPVWSANWDGRDLAEIADRLAVLAFERHQV